MVSRARIDSASVFKPGTYWEGNLRRPGRPNGDEYRSGKFVSAQLTELGARLTPEASVYGHERTNCERVTPTPCQGTHF